MEGGLPPPPGGDILTFKARPNVSVVLVGGCWERRGAVFQAAQWRRAAGRVLWIRQAPARVASGGRSGLGSGQHLGLCRGSGAPPRGIPTRPFPPSVSHAPAATCSVLGVEASALLGCISAAASHSLGRAAPRGASAGARRPGEQPRGPGLGPQARAPWAPSCQVKGRRGRGARWWVGSPRKGSGFLPLIMLFIPLEGVIYRKE